MLCFLPRDSLFWLRATLGTLYPGRISGDQHSPKQMFRHSGQLVGHLCTIYLLGCLWCCPERHLGSSETWHGLRRQESVLTAYPIRNEKRIIYHKHSLICVMFLILFFWEGFWGFFFVVGCFCVVPSPPLTNTRPIPHVLLGYLWHYIFSNTRNNAHIRAHQECKEVLFKPLCSLYKSVLCWSREIIESQKHRMV